jgi:putative ABC transport system substrate-binding protein
MKSLRFVLCLVIFLASVQIPSARPALHADVRIAILKSEDNSVYNEIVEKFTKNCRAKSTEFKMNGNAQTGREAVNKINQDGYILILAVGTSAAIVAKDAARIPVVFCAVFSSEKKRLTGTNITGITLDASAREQFSTFKRLMPNLKALGVVYNPKISADLIREAQTACSSLGLHLETRAVSSPKEVTWAVRDLAGSIDAMWIIADSTVANADNFRYMLLTCLENKLPLLAFSHTFVREGALAALSAPTEDVGAEVAVVVNSLLNGQSISSVPISSPKRKMLYLNLNTARNLHIDIPRDLLASARLFGRES